MEQEVKRRRFDAAFKAGCPLGRTVRLVTEGVYTQAEAARQLGIEAKRISHWIKQMQQRSRFAFQIAARRVVLIQPPMRSAQLQRPVFGRDVVDIG